MAWEQTIRGAGAAVLMAGRGVRSPPPPSPHGVGDVYDDDDGVVTEHYYATKTRY